MRRSRKIKPPFARSPHPSLHVNVMAQQEYCEKMVDLWLENPATERVSLPPELFPVLFEEEFESQELAQEVKKQEEHVALGNEFHKAVETSGPELSWPKVIKLLKKGHSLMFLECNLEGSYNKLPILGKADVVCFEGWRASCVIEYKVTDSPNLFPSYQTQLRLYGYLLEQMSFKVDNLILDCIFVPTRYGEWIRTLMPSKAQKFLQTVRKVTESNIPSATSEKGSWYQSLKFDRKVGIKMGAFRYDTNKTREDLDFLTDYWLGKRTPKPTKKRVKCSKCLYNAVKRCSVALVPFGIA